jgi:type II secretory pathway predicted ATPase ExeA
MPAESLEEIRLLSNLESKAAKLLQIALFAQPNWTNAWPPPTCASCASASPSTST